MTRLSRYICLLAGSGAVLLAMAGCSETVAGMPSPAEEVSASPSARSPEEALADMDACTVLGQLLEGEGFAPGERKTARNECHASKPDYGTYSLALDPVQGLSEYSRQVPGSAPATVNGREARQGEPFGAGQGMCDFALKVGAHGRAVATATMLRAEQRARACDAARELAAELEPLLPKQ
ncbi:hypothetical protein L1857_07170 [Amycolatopsis thermalba]|uniref:DUF3558 domain-containing protein n=1 Tax=Amycolatopsis thermalba TaxID=944492 RepID=A0ABY4NPI3_9PSEU|nr:MULTISPECIES: DUF3558 domain-containing protein [Amycolatopsis]UQS22615.1 hypothetical protein L1857_07170 [Amycolatopsis thermalba]